MGRRFTRMEHKFRGHVVWKLIEVQQEDTMGRGLGPSADSIK